MGTNGFRFDAETHRYFAEGVELPSVTTVLKSCGMVESRARQYFVDRGSALHLACQYFDEGDLDPESVAPQIRPQLEAYIEFCREYEAEWVTNEKALWHRIHRYAGKVDRVGWVKRGGCVVKMVLDLKTGAEERSHKIQTAAYLGLVLQDDGLVRDRACLYLPPRGRYRLKVFERAEFMWDFSVFLSALSVHNWKLSGQRFDTRHLEPVDEGGGAWIFEKFEPH